MGFIVAWVGFAALAWVVGTRKGAAVVCAVLGLLFGPFGFLYALISVGDRIKCPLCREHIRPDARCCPFCRTDLTEYHVASREAEAVASGR